MGRHQALTIVQFAIRASSFRSRSMAPGIGRASEDVRLPARDKRLLLDLEAA